MLDKKQIRDWILKNCVDEDGDIVISDIDFGDRTVDFTKIKAKYIYNSEQKAEEIYNSFQEGELFIENAEQKSEDIDNSEQKIIKNKKGKK